MLRTVLTGHDKTQCKMQTVTCRLQIIGKMQTSVFLTESCYGFHCWKLTTNRLTISSWEIVSYLVFRHKRETILFLIIKKILYTVLKFYPVGSIRSRFQVLSRQLVGGVQSVQPVTWCIFQTLLGKDRAGVLEHSNLLPIRR